MKIFSVIVFICLNGFLVQAQNLTGIWRGTRTQSAGGCFPEYSIELQITFSGTSMMGRAYNYYDREQYTKILFTGKYNPQTKRMVIIESSVVDYNIPASCIPCIKTYDLNYTLTADGEALDGDWKGHEMGNNNACSPGKIHLTRQTETLFPIEIDQEDKLKDIQKTIEFADREKVVVEQFKVDTPEIKIELYDNAEIDDDTVSIFLNNTLLLHKQRLTGQPLILYVSAFPNMDYELMMFAENLGKIPPNTSLMVVTAGNKRYEVRLSANEEKNAVVRFRYERK